MKSLFNEDPFISKNVLKTVCYKTIFLGSRSEEEILSSRSSRKARLFDLHQLLTLLELHFLMLFSCPDQSVMDNF